MKRMLIALALILITGLNCGEEYDTGECRDLVPPVKVTDQNGQVLYLHCECWTGTEWLADCGSRYPF